jgi:hypothetical protein
MWVGSLPNFQKHFLLNWVILIPYFGLAQILEYGAFNVGYQFGFIGLKIIKTNVM